MDYETLRQMADSWGLLYLFVVFIGVIVLTFRPGTKQRADDIAQIPLREDNDDER